MLTSYKLIEVESIVETELNEPVYDLEVEIDHSYVVEDYVVHNSQCLTRRQTGVGMPQFSAVVECADAAHGVGGRVIGDGGIKTPGDFAKCFGAGADFAMAGSMFAAHNENSEFDEDGLATVYGMSSTAAMNKYYGGVNKYRTSEGRITKIESRGPLEYTIQEILGGVRSACTYIGAKNLKDFSKCATFVRVNNQLSKEYEKQTIGK